MNQLTILALDMSSVAIGVCYDGTQFETLRLTGPDIASRCRQARAMVHGLLVLYPDVDLVVIESPVARYASAVIPQARVSGAVLSLISELGLCWIEVSPAAAKHALTGNGNAGKAAMIDAARRATGYELDEHRADSYGLYLAGRGLRALKTSGEAQNGSQRALEAA